VAFAVCHVVRLLLCGRISQSALFWTWLGAGKTLEGLTEKNQAATTDSRRRKKPTPAL
jgi:hypothetical protein